ncbi:MAG: OB-fold nucleic acid binding domain-containing protein, partial [Acidimicrobiia bacterium]
LAGVVRRITVNPEEGLEALEALLSDGTGEISVVWMGRRSIPGLKLGTRVVVEGVVGDHRRGPRMVNPTFQFAS